MRCRGLLRAMVFALVGASAVCAWAQPGVNWVGMTIERSDAPETAQYFHVSLARTAASRLGGTWGPYTLVGAIEDYHIDFTLTDADGVEVGFLRGRIGNDSFEGIGTIVPARRPGSSAKQAQVEVKWTLTRGATIPGEHKIFNINDLTDSNLHSTLWRTRQFSLVDSERTRLFTATPNFDLAEPVESLKIPARR